MQFSKTPKCARLTVCALVFALAAPVSAASIEFEGVAPSGGSLPVGGTPPPHLTVFGEFDVLVENGKYVDSADPFVGVRAPDSGSDWLAVEAGSWLSITRNTVGVFTLDSFYLTQANLGIAGPSLVNVEATNHLGDTLTTSFSTPPGMGAPFAPYMLPASFLNLTQLRFMPVTTSTAFDGLSLTLAPVPPPPPPPPPPGIPEPGTMALFALGAVGLAAHRRRLRRR